jgi:excisionase family DNA binding protein
MRSASLCEPLLLRVEQAAQRLGLGRTLTYRLIQTGELRSIKVAGARRVLVSDLAEFVARIRDETDKA